MPVGVSLLALVAMPQAVEPAPNQAYFGSSFTFCGDVDGDERADYAVGSCGEGSGVLRVYSGATGEVLETLPGKDGDRFFTRVLAVAHRSGSDYLVTSSERSGRGILQLWSIPSWKLWREIIPSASGAHFGSRIETLGDVDGDACDELLVQADATSFMVVSTATCEATSFFEPPGEISCSFRDRVTVLGDLDGDGRPEFALGARSSVLVCSAGRGGVEVMSEARLDRHCMERSFSAMPDLDDDGVLDLAVGLPGNRPRKQRGEVRFFSGRDGSPLGLLEDPAETSYGFGHSLALGDDFDGDGARDLYVARYELFVDAVLAFSGRSGKLLFEVPAPEEGEDAVPPDLADHMIVGGDIDGDGVRDVLANRFSPFAIGTPGQGVVVLSGAAPRIVRRHVLPLTD